MIKRLTTLTLAFLLLLAPATGTLGTTSLATGNSPSSKENVKGKTD